MKTNVMTLDESFLDSSINKAIEEKVEVKEIRPLISIILGARFKNKIATDTVSSIIQAYEHGHSERTGKYSIFSSFFNIKDPKNGKTFYDISLYSETKEGKVETTVEINNRVEGRNGLDFLIKDSLTSILNYVNYEKMEASGISKDVEESIIIAIEDIVISLSEQAQSLFSKDIDDNEILLALAFSVFGPYLSEFYEEFTMMETKDDNQEK